MSTDGQKVTEEYSQCQVIESQGLYQTEMSQETHTTFLQITVQWCWSIWKITNIIMSARPSGYTKITKNCLND